MSHRIEVGSKEGQNDAVASNILNFSQRLGLDVTGVRRIKAYTIDKDLATEDLNMLTRQLFSDPIVEISSVDDSLARKDRFSYLIEVGFKPGVMDTVGNTAAEAIGDTIGQPFGKGEAVYTSAQLLISGDDLTPEGMERLACEYLANDNIQRWRITDYQKFQSGGHDFDSPRVRMTRKPTVEYIGLDIPDKELFGISRDRSLSLNLREMQAIQEYFSRHEVIEARRSIGLTEKPTDAELEVLGQTWSEHCKHKIFNARVSYSEGDHEPEEIDSMFDTYIKSSTKALQERLPWVLSTLEDNAGVIQFNDKWLLAFKGETHNSPSNVEPFGGAVTGIVGVYRDPMGTGMGSRIIFGTYGFCTGFPDYDGKMKPRLHPSRLLEGVRSGVEDGGNKSGVPTPFGQTYFHDGFIGKPAIYVLAGGLIPSEVDGKPGFQNEVESGDFIVMAGGRVGIDGIHGATQSSMEAGENITAGHVQIGSPYTQKKMMDFSNEARDLGLYRCITDNGAGGLSSSVGEMARKSGGFEMHLDRVPLKYDGLNPWQIIVSESQERMTLAVDPKRYGELEDLAREHGVELSNLGEYNDSGMFSVYHDGKPVAHMDMDFVHDGVPQMELTAKWKTPEERDLVEPELEPIESHGAILHQILRRPNVAGKEYIARQFDHEVQGTSVVKPLVGKESDVFSDAAVLRPDFETYEGIAVTAGLNPAYGDVDTYNMTAAAFDEAIRRVIAVGGSLKQIALNDNFCWPSPLPSDSNPDSEYKMAQLVRANKALYDTSMGYGTPCVSGKDSMSMDGPIDVLDDEPTRVSAPPTLQMSAVGKIDDVRKAITMDVKSPGDLVYVLGLTKDELGGSEFYLMSGNIGIKAPEVDIDRNTRLYNALSDAMEEGLIRSAHGCYKGGLGVTLAQKSFAGGYGMDVHLDNIPLDEDLGNARILYSESAGRYVVTVRVGDRKRFESVMGENSYGHVGTVRGDGILSVYGTGDERIVQEDIGALKESWQSPFRGM